MYDLSHEKYMVDTLRPVVRSLQGNSESTSQSKENRYRWVIGLDHNLGKGQM